MYYTSNERMVEILEHTKEHLQENMKDPEKCNLNASYFTCVVAESYCNTGQEELDISDYISQHLHGEYTFMSYLMKHDLEFAILRTQAYLHGFQSVNLPLMIEALKYEMEKKYEWIDMMISKLQQP